MNGKDIQKIRTKMGLKQVEFAKIVGVHSVTVCRWENDDAVPTPHQMAIIEACQKAAAKQKSKIGSRVAGALIGAGVGVALYLIFDAAFGNDKKKGSGKDR